jgi:hypothetical protein
VLPDDRARRGPASTRPAAPPRFKLDPQTGSWSRSPTRHVGPPTSGTQGLLGQVEGRRTRHAWLERQPLSWREGVASRIDMCDIFAAAIRTHLPTRIVVDCFHVVQSQQGGPSCAAGSPG